AVHRRRGRRDEARDFLGGQKRVQRHGVRMAKFPKHHAVAREHRQAAPPIGADDGPFGRAARLEPNGNFVTIRHALHRYRPPPPPATADVVGVVIVPVGPVGVVVLVGGVGVVPIAVVAVVAVVGPVVVVLVGLAVVVLVGAV